MKIRTSYFYQIRNFKKYMIPVSTALWDPKWYHDNQGHSCIFYDKRGIINGIRLEALISKAKGCGLCPCNDKDYENCLFLKEYRKRLDNIDFDRMYKDMENFANRYKQNEGFEEEPIIVLIVYETPQNHCSERQALIDYFNSKGVECKELDYPIQEKLEIKKGEFEF